MRMLTFAKRNALEILRDPLNLFFGLGFPLNLRLLYPICLLNSALNRSLKLNMSKNKLLMFLPYFFLNILYLNK